MRAMRVCLVQRQTQNCLRKRKTILFSQSDALDDDLLHKTRVIFHVPAALLHFPSYGEHAQWNTNKCELVLPATWRRPRLLLYVVMGNCFNVNSILFVWSLICTCLAKMISCQKALQYSFITISPPHYNSSMYHVADCIIMVFVFC